MTKSQKRPQGWLVGRQQKDKVRAETLGMMGMAYALQKKFEESYQILSEAVQIDPNYDRAKENLENLDYWREHPDEKPGFMITSPFQDVKTNITLLYSP